MTLLDDSEYERWRSAATDAGKSAELEAHASHHNWACFLAEQAAQLGVKAVLHGIGAGAWGHDLVRLGEALQDSSAQGASPVPMAAMRRLSRHYIPTRYPDAHPSGPPAVYYGEEDSAAALADLSEILSYVDARWAELNKGEGQIHAESDDSSTGPA